MGRNAVWVTYRTVHDRAVLGVKSGTPVRGIFKMASRAQPQPTVEFVGTGVLQFLPFARSACCNEASAAAQDVICHTDAGCRILKRFDCKIRAILHPGCRCCMQLQGCERSARVSKRPCSASASVSDHAAPLRMLIAHSSALNSLMSTATQQSSPRLCRTHAKHACG